jgi:GNAT superfamily N-acetyltransferase
MTLAFDRVAFAEIGDRVRAHYAALPSPVDSFLEDHILASTHYRIAIDGEMAGWLSVHQEHLITQFSLEERFQARGQAVFAEARRMEQVHSAFVPTCDEFYLAHALDTYRRLEMQAYFFVTGPAPRSRPDGYSLRQASADDHALIADASGDFFDDLDRRIAAGELFVTERGGAPVAFGISVPSALYEQVASIGMFTIEAHRRTGAATATIAGLIDQCRAAGVRPIAGCWYYNHGSKRTLERAGMRSPTRLLKIGF